MLNGKLFVCMGALVLVRSISQKIKGCLWRGSLWMVVSDATVLPEELQLKLKDVL
jgi:hypothetical protein